MSTEKLTEDREILLRLTEAMAQIGLTKADVSRITGYSKSQVGDIVAGKANITDKFIRIFCHASNVSEQWFRTGGGNMRLGRFAPSPFLDANTSSAPSFKGMVPLISWVKAGAWSEIEDTYAPGDAEYWVPVTMNVSKQAFALRVSGTSMEPDYREGDVIVVDPGTEAYSGAMVVVRLNGDNESTFKKLVMDGGKVYLEPLNHRYQPMEITGKDYTICGVVVQMTRDIKRG